MCNRKTVNFWTTVSFFLPIHNWFVLANDNIVSNPSLSHNICQQYILLFCWSTLLIKRHKYIVDSRLMICNIFLWTFILLTLTVINLCCMVVVKSIVLVISMDIEFLINRSLSERFIWWNTRLKSTSNIMDEFTTTLSESFRSKIVLIIFLTYGHIFLLCILLISSFFAGIISCTIKLVMHKLQLIRISSTF